MLYGISKRGNIYLRRMLIHGAKAVLLRVKYDTGGFSHWVHQLQARAPQTDSALAAEGACPQNSQLKAHFKWSTMNKSESWRI